MNSDQIKGKLKQLAGEMRRKWSQFAYDDLTQAGGDFEVLVGKIERSEERREEVERWFKSHGMG